MEPAITQTVFNGVHLVIGLALFAVGFFAGAVYGTWQAEDDYYDDVAELKGEIDKLKARAGK